MGWVGGGISLHRKDGVNCTCGRAAICLVDQCPLVWCNILSQTFLALARVGQPDYKDRSCLSVTHFKSLNQFL